MKKYVITEDDIASLASVFIQEGICVKGYLGKTCDNDCENCWTNLLIEDFCKPYTKECSCPSEAVRRQVLLENMTEDV